MAPKVRKRFKLMRLDPSKIGEVSTIALIASSISSECTNIEKNAFITESCSTASASRSAKESLSKLPRGTPDHVGSPSSWELWSVLLFEPFPAGAVLSSVREQSGSESWASGHSGSAMHTDASPLRTSGALSLLLLLLLLLLFPLAPSSLCLESKLLQFWFSLSSAALAYSDAILEKRSKAASTCCGLSWSTESARVSRFSEFM
mmetsp:Transcript_19955/g.37067  ORF Transcript_19955/g.37067 Transcript_19955/m.37067 type:complete len:204 (-) Transcript_19955:309-920(-)